MKERDLIQAIEQARARLSAAMAAAQAWAGRADEAASQEFAHATSSADETQARELSAARTERESAERRVGTILARIPAELGTSQAAWDDPAWQSFQPPAPDAVPYLTRIGTLTARTAPGQVQTAALVPVIGSGNLIIEATGAGKRQALHAVQSVMLRLLATLPAGKLRFVLIDPVGLGSNVAGFMHLPEDLIGGQAWTEPAHIERQLQDLSAHMEIVIQKYLLNDFQSMEHYNSMAGEVEEAYRVLVIDNFPVNFNEAAAQRLISIASNGPRTGVYVLAVVDQQQNAPPRFNLDDLRRTGTVIRQNGDRFQYLDQVFGQCELSLDALPNDSLFSSLLTTVSEAAASKQSVQVPFTRLATPAAERWCGNATHELSALIGREGANKDLVFTLDQKTSVHGLLAGKPGSGKSNLLHVLITSLALKYSPDELELYLVDFKQGVEFKDYARFQLPHAPVIAIQSEREFGLSVLRALDREFQKRGDVLRGRNYENLAQFREANPNERLPRILLIVDEFQEFFREDDALAREAANLIDRLVRQGRSFGIHLLLCTQSLARSGLQRGTADLMHLRMALQLGDADSRLILGDDNPAARLLSRPGEAIYNDNNGLIESNRRFQVLWLDDDDRERYLQQIAKLEKSRPSPLHPRARQVVFEGDAPARLEHNEELSQLLEDPKLPASASTKLWLGEPVSMAAHVAATFRRQSRSNLLIVGQNEEAAAAMTISGLISVAAQRSPREVGFRIANLAVSDEAWQASLAALEGLPHADQMIGRREVPDALAELSAALKSRIAAPEAEWGKTICLVLFGLQRIRELRSDDPYKPTQMAGQLGTICREGPEYGIHVLTWCDTFANLERSLGRREIAEFEQRVGLQMSPKDSSSLLDTPAAGDLGPYRAILLDEQRVGRAEKFRPYGLMPEAWLREELPPLIRRRFEGVAEVRA